jgi:hypothetical protein
MTRTCAHGVLAALLLLLPARLLAGGPPYLSLPLEGVTAKNSQACTDLLNAKLADKLWQQGGNWQRSVKLVQHDNQWYAAFYMGGDVRLADVTASLLGSAFSVPENKLRLFGHVTLEIDARSAPQQVLFADLKTLKQVSVAESKAEKGALLITIDMPYPIESSREGLDSVGWDAFQRCDFNSAPATRAESPTKSNDLPSYTAIRDLVAKHGATLKGLRWSETHACRPLGAVAAPAEKTAAASR